jgi:hypothetical protein
VLPWKKLRGRGGEVFINCKFMSDKKFSASSVYILRLFFVSFCELQRPCTRKLHTVSLFHDQLSKISKCRQSSLFRIDTFITLFQGRPPSHIISVCSVILFSISFISHSTLIFVSSFANSLFRFILVSFYFFLIPSCLIWFSVIDVLTVLKYIVSIDFILFVSSSWTVQVSPPYSNRIYSLVCKRMSTPMKYTK